MGSESSALEILLTKTQSFLCVIFKAVHAYFKKIKGIYDLEQEPLVTDFVVLENQLSDRSVSRTGRHENEKILQF